jgi:hypothetical protein
LLKDGTKSPWVISKDGKDYKLVNEAVFRAAAITPLSIEENQITGTLTFHGATFLDNALSESETDGNA